MKKNLVSLLSATAAVAVVTFNTAPVIAGEGQTDKPAGALSATMTRTATVTKIDKADRWITLKMDDGTVRDIHAGPAVKNFDQIKVGDQVVASLEETLAIEVVPAGEAAPGASSGSSVVTAPPGSKPMAVMVDTATVTGKVTAIDHGKRSVTLVGPAGASRTIEVGPGVKKFDAIQKGDNVVMTLKAATTIEVMPPGKSGMKPSTP